MKLVLSKLPGNTLSSFGLATATLTTGLERS
jgi:hypothetical protein